MRYQAIYDIAEICARKRIRQAVLCPGSRCAPLTLAFARHPEIKTRTFSDERSAGFIALGLAQATGDPVVVVCTSGSAVYNLAPAVAEAYFSQTPLIILTADRPAEWIGQLDGQTIFQQGAFGNHVKSFSHLPQDYEHADSLWAINRTINDAVNHSRRYPAGPVHINAPFREPLYPAKDEGQILYSTDLRIEEDHNGIPNLSGSEMETIRLAWKGFKNVLLVVGQHRGDAQTIEAVSTLRQEHFIPVVHDIISNLHTAGETVQHSDLFLGQADDRLKEMLRPDLLITFGESVLSKNLKLFLRKYPAKRHWHIQPAGAVADTFQHLTDVFRTTPSAFLDFVRSLEAEESFDRRKQQNYYRLWEVEERRCLRSSEEFFGTVELSEISLVKAVMDNLPDGAKLHLANSMSVRYGNFIGLKRDRNVQIFSNRGTSGIDGSTSTAVGHALASDAPNFLITGDLAFFYDRNAFWHNYTLHNLRILLLNNHGGLIFDVLEGPSSVAEAEEFFITRQTLNGKKLCEEFGFDRLEADHPRKIKNLLKDFMEFDGRTKVLEIEGSTASNKKVLETLKTKIKKSYES